MQIVKEKDKDYRFGESGPKYLLRGPKIDFGVVRLLPGEDFPDHYHNVVEENFFVLEGEVDFLINGEIRHHAVSGDLLHIPAPESHYLKNNGSVAAKIIFAKAPYKPEDKVDVK
jgi:quercetin dioxygenase-like cupin family protein